MSTPSGNLARYLDECRTLVTEEIRRIIPNGERRAGILYQLIFDYPLREGKALRPALCIATCCALGGKLDAVLRSAAVLELYHNAFLIHDDIEDESLMRRGGPTLHRVHGIPIAVNVGDAMLSLSLQPLLDNIGVIGLGPSLRILDAVARMTRESVEGQAIELDWVKRGSWNLDDDDYIHMVEQKTGWYSFITPVAIGAIAAKLDPERTGVLTRFARRLGVAFQIQDDVLNLRGDVGEYGKEIGGDLWEGKRTLMLLHALRNATDQDRSDALRVLAQARPSDDEAGSPEAVIGELVREGELSTVAAERLRAALGGPRQVKTAEGVRFLLSLMERHGSIEYARDVARAWVVDAANDLEACRSFLPPSPHRSLLEGLVDYVLSRVR